jgi:hypothetical protein
VCYRVLFQGRLVGLSRMWGNSHVRFLGGGAAVTLPCYQTSNQGALSVASTKIEWSYTPTDLFEAPLTIQTPHGAITLHNGKATATLAQAVTPVPEDVISELGKRVTVALRARQLLTHRVAELQPGHAIMYEDDEGRRGVTVGVVTANAVLVKASADVIVRDADGNIVHDSRAERIACDEAFVQQLEAVAQRSLLVRRLLESYSHAVSDPSDELVHLYEIRDAVFGHYGNNKKARQALGWSKAQWDELGVLADAEPLEQGRHRGKHPVRRPATQQELDRARRAARSLIEAVAQHV